MVFNRRALSAGLLLILMLIFYLVLLNVTPSGAQTGGGITVNNRVTAQICQNVANIIVDNSQTQNATVSEVDDQLVVEISQKLNVSPTVVQTCIQRIANKDHKVDRAGGDRDDGNVAVGEAIIVEDGDITDEITDEITDKVIDTAPNKPLPFTGGWPVYLMVASFVLAGAGLLGVGLGIGRRRRR